MAWEGLNIFGRVSDRFSDLFSRFSNRFSYRLKSFSGAVSFCRHAALKACFCTFTHSPGNHGRMLHLVTPFTRTHSLNYNESGQLRLNIWLGSVLKNSVDNVHLGMPCSASKDSIMWTADSQYFNCERNKLRFSANSSPCLANLSREGFCRNPRGIFLNKVAGEFCGDFLVDLFGLFSLENTGGKNHPKIHGKIRIRIRELRGQNPHCKDLALTI